MCLWQIKLSQAKTIIKEKSRRRKTLNVCLRRKSESRSNVKSAVRKFVNSGKRSAQGITALRKRRRRKSDPRNIEKIAVIISAQNLNIKRARNFSDHLIISAFLPL